MADLFARIDSLNDRLTPLASKQRGMRIEAEEWNTLIDVLRGLLAIDRAQEQIVGAELGENFAPREHQHLQQVAADWLAADLRANMVGGGGDIPSRVAVADLRKYVDTFKTQLGELAAQLADQGRRVDLSATSELDRQRQLRSFENRFAGIEDLRGSVSAVNGRLNGLSDNLETVLALRERWTDESGAPIDLTALRQSVGSLQQLRDNLSGADGRLLRLRDVVVQLDEVRDALALSGEGGGLDSRITLAVAASERRLQTDLQQRLDAQGGQLRAENAASALGMRNDVDAGLAVRFAAQQQASEQFAASRVGELGDRLAARNDERLDAARSALLAETLRAAEQFAAANAASLPERIDAALAGEREALAARLNEELAARLGEGLRADMTAAVAGFGERLDAVERNAAALPDALNTRLAGEIADVRAALSDELSTSLMATLSSRIAALGDGLLSALAQQLRADVGQALGDIDGRIAETVAGRLGDLDARLAASVDRLSADLSAQVNESLRREITALNLDARFSSLETRLNNQFRAEMRDALASERQRNSSELNNTVSALRQEIDAARVSATNDAVRLSQTQSVRTNTQVNNNTVTPVGGVAIIR